MTVGIETTGYALLFHALMQKLGRTLLVGEAVKIRAMVVRRRLIVDRHRGAGYERD